MTIKNLSKTKNIEFLPVYVDDEGGEAEPEELVDLEVVDLKCGGAVCERERQRARTGGREGGRERREGLRERGKEGGRQTD